MTEGYREAILELAVRKDLRGTGKQLRSWLSPGSLHQQFGIDEVACDTDCCYDGAFYDYVDKGFHAVTFVT